MGSEATRGGLRIEVPSNRAALSRAFVMSSPALSNRLFSFFAKAAVSFRPITRVP